MSKLTILRGLSGCGKSTWAEAQTNAVVVSRDALRVALYGGDGPDYYKHPDLRSREEYITTVEHAAIREALRAGKDVISDNTNIEIRYMKPIIKIGHVAGATIEVKAFDVPLHTALERNRQRAVMGGRNVPESTIRKQHDRFQHTKNFEAPVPPKVQPYAGTPGKPKAFMVDIDGTLAHHEGLRSPYGLNVEVDEPDEVVIDVVRNLAGDHTPYNVIVMSGRKETCRTATEDWLDNYIVFDELFMRAADDDRADNLVKHDLFNEHVRDNYDVQFVIDDRWQVCEMWLTMGLKVFNVSGLDRGEF